MHGKCNAAVIRMLIVDGTGCRHAEVDPETESFSYVVGCKSTGLGGVQVKTLDPGQDSVLRRSADMFSRHSGL